MNDGWDCKRCGAELNWMEIGGHALCKRCMNRESELRAQAEKSSGIEAGPGRPNDGYLLEDGTKVTSVTELLSRWKDSEALLKWSAGQGGIAVWKEMSRGRIFSRDPEKAESIAYRVGRDGPEGIKNRAADAGSKAHDMVERAIHNVIYGDFVERAFDNPLDEEQLRWAKNAFAAWKEWRASRPHFRFLATEVPLISNKLRIGGTPDGWGVDVLGDVELLDWKTSGDFYIGYVYQCAAYTLMLEELRGLKATDVSIVRMDKETAKPSVVKFGGLCLKKAQRQFRLLHEAFFGDRELRGFLPVR